MNTRFLKAASAAFALIVVAAGSAAADQYEITIRNATAGQPLTPPVAIAHDGNYTLFNIGQPSSEPLATLAETGSPADLAAAAGSDPYVADVALQDEPGLTLPGAETTIRLDTDADYVDIAAMLALTNDAFFAVRRASLPALGETLVLRPTTYDSGSESNNEGSAYVPGLMGMQRATEGAEGFVHVHRGLSGIGDLVIAQHSWRDPAVEIVINNTGMTN
jgi:hypothetical protein